MSEPINECWRSIDGYLNYQVSNIGRVRNCDTGRILRGTIDHHGYNIVSLSKDRAKRKIPVHRLVAHEFIPNESDKPFVDHIDTNKLNNCVTNLRWATNRENQGNSIKQSDRSSIYKGVYYDRSRRKWMARITIHGTMVNLGRYQTEVEAARAYNAKALEVFGEFAKLNEISEG